MASSSTPACSKFPNIVLNPTPLRYAPPGTEPLVRSTTDQSSSPSVGPSTEPPPPSETPKKMKKRPQKPPKSTDEVQPAAPANEETPPVTAKKSRKSKGEELPAVSSEFKRPDWLPEGWIIKEHIREQGKSAGTKDKYYIEPVTGKRFRSQREVQRHLGMSVETPKQNPSKNEAPKGDERFSRRGE